jgi:cell wall-associated NlpC family hydrolase
MTFNRLTAGQGLLAEAETQYGVPYLWGGETPGVGFDCSGLVQWAARKVGINLPRSTSEQFHVARIDNTVTSEPGDLLFIAGSDGTIDDPGHVMIFKSDGWVVQAPFTGEDVNAYKYDTTIFDFRTRPALLLPLPIHPPTSEQIKKRGLVALPDAAQAHIAVENKWPLFIWNGNEFIQTFSIRIAGVRIYANAHYKERNPGA